jgi:glycosyltransferase involved in cell wall biosynthesis
LKRKNAIGLIDAFCEAFAPNEGPVLVLKSINADKRLIEFEKLKWECRGRSDIIVIDEYFDVVKAASLMAVSDCYVSLHRSEGLGLTMAEAMALGKPVIATGYSGNMDFMSEENSILIPWTLVPVGKDAESYPPLAMWAEPNLEAASAAMRRVYEDKGFARKLGVKAQSDIAENFSPEKTGERMKSRLESHIWR